MMPSAVNKSIADKYTGTMTQEHPLFVFFSFFFRASAYPKPAKPVMMLLGLPSNPDPLPKSAFLALARKEVPDEEVARILRASQASRWCTEAGEVSVWNIWRI